MNSDNHANERLQELTDWLLGELTDERAAELEREVAADPVLRREVEEMQASLALLRQSDVAPALSDARRQSLNAAALSGLTGTARRNGAGPRGWWSFKLAAA